MLYRKFIFINILFLLSNCTSDTLRNNKSNIITQNNYTNKGFTLIFNNDLFDKKIISKKLDQRSLIIFQKNLKRNTQVKITNISNNKSLIVKVGQNSNYPSFNNSVISKRIAEELVLDINEPYVEIVEITKNALFIAKKAKTHDEEKKVANKAPINSISINDLNVGEVKVKKIYNKKVTYIIKVADFYFKDTASAMLERIIIETKIKKPNIQKISNKKYRVYLGPFDNINSLQNSYNDINILQFENIEIIRND